MASCIWHWRWKNRSLTDGLPGQLFDGGHSVNARDVGRLKSQLMRSVKTAISDGAAGGPQALHSAFFGRNCTARLSAHFTTADGRQDRIHVAAGLRPKMVPRSKAGPTRHSGRGVQAVLLRIRSGRGRIHVPVDEPGVNIEEARPTSRTKAKSVSQSPEPDRRRKCRRCRRPHSGAGADTRRNHHSLDLA